MLTAEFASLLAKVRSRWQHAAVPVMPGELLGSLPPWMKPGSVPSRTYASTRSSRAGTGSQTLRITSTGWRCVGSGPTSEKQVRRPAVSGQVRRPQQPANEASLGPPSSRMPLRHPAGSAQMRRWRAPRVPPETALRAARHAETPRRACSRQARSPAGAIGVLE